MLNEYLPRPFLEHTLRRYIDPINFILSQIEPERDRSLIEDKRTLGKLHHALNVEKYGHQEFRKDLLTYAPRDKLEEFLTSLNKPSAIPSDTHAYHKLIDELSSFQWGNNKETEYFLEIFGYETNLKPLQSQPVAPAVKIPAADRAYKTLKDYQCQVFFDSVRLTEIPNQRFLIQMPTGAGKTRVAIELICHYLNKHKDAQVVWLADKVELCEQAIETFLDIWPHVSKNDLSLYRVWKNMNPPDSIQGPAFVVTMYQKLRSILKSKQDFPIKPDLIITDEAHNVLAPTYGEVIDRLIHIAQKDTIVIGLTATPGRSYKDSEQNQQLAEFFMKRIVEIDSNEQGVIEYLQGKRILAHAVRKPLDTKIQYTLTPQEWKKFSKDFTDYPDEFLRRIAEDQRRNVLIAFKLLELAQQARQVLFFAASVDQSKMLCGLMISKGFAAAHVDASTPSSYRNDVVKKFREGTIKFIFNYEIFAAGFDAPGIDTVFIARPTTSIVLFSQMIGRGMRGPELTGTEEFILIDVVDKIIIGYSGLDDVYSYFADYWDEQL